MERMPSSQETVGSMNREEALTDIQETLNLASHGCWLSPDFHTRDPQMGRYPGFPLSPKSKP